MSSSASITHIHLPLIRARSEMAIEDTNGRLIAMCAGTPRAPDWPENQTRACRLAEEVREFCAFKPSHTAGHRGDHPSLACGVTGGQGQKVRMRF